MKSFRLASSLVFCAVLIPAARVPANPDTRGEASGRIPGWNTARGAQGPVVAPHRTAAASDGTLYGIDETLGFLVSHDGGETWSERNQGLPRKTVYPFDAPQPLRPLAALGVDPANPQRVALVTNSELYLSENGGLEWQQIPTSPPGPRRKGWPGSVTIFTSVALSPFDPHTILVGTSFEGAYETRDRGRSWSDLGPAGAFMDRGARFFEEIAGIAYDPAEPGAIALGLGFGYGVYRCSADRTRFTDLGFPGAAEGETVRCLQYTGSGALRVATDRAEWSYSGGAWQRIAALEPPSRARGSGDSDRSARRALAAGRAGLYISSLTAGSRRFGELLAWARQQGLNSIVVDFKDDEGIVAYDTSLELPRAVGAVRKRFAARELLAQAHAAGLYVIARLVVFKDRALYHYRDGTYAVWDRQRDAAWRNLVRREDQAGNVTLQQVEFWVDPYSEFVWDYNIAIAREIQELGADEIQFDYIRFPTDGDLSTIVYRHRRPGMVLTDALESFLAKARAALRVPISVDLYGFNAWHRMGGWNGQSIEAMSRYVDVICPMFYPSHFPADFLRKIPYIERAERIYSEGTARAASIVNGASLIRPYVQAFRIYGELKMSPAEYTEYLRAQLRGASTSRGSGFTLWNASNDYYMASFPLAAYLPRREE